MITTIVPTRKKNIMPSQTMYRFRLDAGQYESYDYDNPPDPESGKRKNIIHDIGAEFNSPRELDTEFGKDKFTRLGEFKQTMGGKKMRSELDDKEQKQNPDNKTEGTEPNLGHSAEDNPEEASAKEVENKLNTEHGGGNKARTKQLPDNIDRMPVRDLKTFAQQEGIDLTNCPDTKNEILRRIRMSVQQQG